MTNPIPIGQFKTTLLSLYNEANETKHKNFSDINGGKGLDI